MGNTNNYIAYIDESGDPHFDSKASKLFTVCAILFRDDKEESLREEIDGILKTENIKRFKSSKIESYTKRYKLCQRISNLDINILTVTAYKYNLVGDWTKYKDNFYKFIFRTLHYELYRVYDNINVNIHRYKSSKFDDSLHKYLHRNMQTELFSTNIITSTKGTECFAQLVDFIGGTIRKSLSGDFDNMNANALELLKKKWKVRKEFKGVSDLVNPNAFYSESKYFSICVEEAERYLRTHNKESHSAKVRTLDYLFESVIQEPTRYIYTSEILNWLADHGIILSEEQFRNEVIAALRDDGLIIVGTRKGLKIPTTSEDLIEYIHFSTRLALPVLKRLRKAIIFLSGKKEFEHIERTLGSEMRAILNQVIT